MKRSFAFIPILAFLFVLPGCQKKKGEGDEKSSKDSLTKEVVGKPGPGSKIVIRKKWKWRISQDPLDCKSGRGLCISGPFEVPDPNDIVPHFQGFLVNGGDGDLQMHFDEDLIKENELVSDGHLLVDSSFQIGSGFCKLLELSQSKIRKGKYKIEKSGMEYDLVVRFKLE